MTKKNKEEKPFSIPDGENTPDVKIRLSDGSSASLSSLHGEKGLVISFVRSLDWCPFCKKQVRGLNDIAANLTDAGWNLAALAYDSPEVMKEFEEKNELNFPLLSDESSAVIDAFNLRNHNVKPGGRSVGVPHPAILFVGSDGKMKATLNIPGYQKRPSPEDVLEVMKKLKKG